MMEWVEYMTSDANSPMANLRRQNGREQPWKVKFFGVGNESWGCGGNMTPEYYADQFRRYNTFVKNYPGNQIYRIACGANDFNFRWTEVMMENVGRRMNGLSVHYYTIPHSWDRKGSATQFTEDEWHQTLRKALEMETIVTKHGALMDKQDPEKRIGMIVDEWGTWYDVEPGTNPGFLYQQNTMRDALVAGLTLNIFNRHCDRVKMANIAQTINVLQSVILTDKERMLLTPTYHAFEMYSVHQDATLLPLNVTAEDYVAGQQRIPGIQASASRNAGGAIHISICNLHPSEEVSLKLTVRGASVKTATARVLAATTITAHNTFEQPDVVSPKTGVTAELADGAGAVTLPARSITVLTVQ
jgi:alpha-N-arabinofuranosidase